MLSPQPEAARQHWFPKADLMFVSGISLLIALGWWLMTPVMLLTDSLDYLGWVRRIQFETPGYLAGHRTIGYPFFLLFTGVGFETFNGTLLTQALLAASIAPASWFTMRCGGVARVPAVVVAVAMSALLIHIHSQHYIMTEALSSPLRHLVLALAAGLLLRWRADDAAAPRWLSGRTLLFLLVGVLAGALALTRPSMGLSFWIVLAVFIVFSRPLPWRGLTLALLIYSLMMTGSRFFDDYQGTGLGQRPLNTTRPHDRAKDLFVRAYFANAGTDRPSLFVADGGAASEARRAAERYLIDQVELWRGRAPVRLFEPYAETPALLLERVWAEPDLAYIDLLWDGMVAGLGFEGAEAAVAGVLASSDAVDSWATDFLPWSPAPTHWKWKILLSQAYREMGYMPVPPEAVRAVVEAPTVEAGAATHPEVSVAESRWLRFMHRYLVDYESNWSALGPPSRYSDFKGRPVAFLENFMVDRDASYHWLSSIAMDQMLTARGAERVTQPLVLGHLREQPLTWLRYFTGRLGRVLFVTQEPPDPLIHANTLVPNHRDGLTDEVTAAQASHARGRPWIQPVLGFVARTVPVAAVISLLTLIPALLSPQRALVVLLWGVVLSDAALNALMVDLSFRITMAWTSVVWILAAVSVQATVTGFRRRLAGRRVRAEPVAPTGRTVDA